MPRISSLEEFSELPSLIFVLIIFSYLLLHAIFTCIFCKWLLVCCLIGFYQPNRDDDDDDDGTVTDNLS